MPQIPVPAPTGSADVCPRCTATLATVDDHLPWCVHCEWNLDTVQPDEGDGWLIRTAVAADLRAGFRADRELTRTAITEESPDRDLRAGYLFLCLVSGVLLIGCLALLAVGLRLVVASGFFPSILLGVLLIAVAYGLRPRLGRLRQALRGCYRLDPEQAPALRALIDRIASRTGAPGPDIVLLDEEWNASVQVVGWRRTRVLTLGVPLLIALRGPELVALIGHELGHFRYADSRRNLLTQPARTVFGALAVAVRPPRGDVHDRQLYGIYALFYTVWQLVAGALSGLLFALHLGMHLIGAAGQRRAEVRADLLAARAAGSAGALGLYDALALMPQLTRCLQPIDATRGALTAWRGSIDHVRLREVDRIPWLRQLTCRQETSLLASHPAPGRRHQVLAVRPEVPAAVVLTEAESAAIDTEFGPYVEALRRRISEVYEL